MIKRADKPENISARIGEPVGVYHYASETHWVSLSATQLAQMQSNLFTAIRLGSSDPHVIKQTEGGLRLDGEVFALPEELVGPFIAVLTEMGFG